MRKKILIITPEFPYPLNSGGKQAQYHIINKLRDRYDISLLFQADNIKNHSFQELKKQWGNVTFYPFFSGRKELCTPRPKSFKEIIYSLSRKIKQVLFSEKRQVAENVFEDDYVRRRSTLYTSVLIWYTNDFLEYIYETSRKDFDIIQVEFYDYLSLAHVLPKEKEKIFVHHEIRFVRNELEMNLLNNANAQDYFIFDLSKKYELDTLSMYDKVIVLSDIDKEKLMKELSGKPIYSSPAMIEANIKPELEKYQFNNKVVFIGSCSHYPNEDGIRWFLQNIWYKLSEKHSELELHLIGDWAKFVDKAGFDRSNIYIHAYVEDLGSIFLNSIMVVPIRIGSGIRMKIIDAINYRIPFVTTSIGVEGLDFKTDIDCLIADTSEDFVDSLSRLAVNPDLQATLISNSAKTMDSLYDENYVLSQRIEVYDSILN